MSFIFSFEDGDHLFPFGIKLLDRQQDLFDFVVENGVRLNQQVIPKAFSDGDERYDDRDENDERIPDGQPKSK